MADQDWALIQAVENARILRRSETRKMEAQVSTKCLMRADEKRQKDVVKRARLEATGQKQDEVKPLPGGVKPAMKRSMMGKASHKRDRAMRRMYGDLTPEEIEEMNAARNGEAESKKKKKKKKTLHDEDHHGTDGDAAHGTGESGNTAASMTMTMGHASTANAGVSSASLSGVQSIAAKMSQNVGSPTLAGNDASDTRNNTAATSRPTKGKHDKSKKDVLPEEMDLEESMASPGAGQRKPFGVVFKPYGGDTFGTRGKYTEGMVYQSRLTRNNKKKKGLLASFFDPGRPKVHTPREEEDDVVSEISVDLNSKQRCAATLCNLSSIPENIENLVNEGALEAVVKLAHGDDTTVAHNCAVTLCNISSSHMAAVRLVRGVSGSNNGGTAFDAVIALSHSESEDVRTVCLLTLYRLSQVPALEASMVAGNAVPALMRLRHESPECALIMARTIFNLANVKEVYLRIEKVIQGAVTIASTATTNKQLVCCARTFKTLGNKVDLRARLLEEGVMAACITMLNKSADSDIVHTELVELCCSVLHDLASCPRNRLSMVREKIVGTVVALANVPNQRDRIRGICAGIISELAQSEGNQVQVINQGLGVLLKLADSDDRRTRAMCAETLCELSRSRRGCPRVVKSGGIQLLTGLLERDGANKGLRRKVAEALSNLMKPEWTQEDVLKGAMPSVVGLVKTTTGGRTINKDDRAARTAAIKIVYGMSSEAFMCSTLEKCDAMEALLPLARTGATNIAVQMRCVASVCNISRATSGSSTQRLANAGAVGIFLGCIKQSVGDADGVAGVPGRAVVDSVAALCNMAEDPSCAEQIVQQGLHSLIKLALHGILPPTTTATKDDVEKKKDDEGEERATNNGFWSSKAREWCSVILCRLSENKSTRKSQVLKGVCSAVIGLASNLQVSGGANNSQSAQEDVAQRCAAAFNNYSLDASSIARLVEDGVIEVLLKLATSYSEQCRENCARALCNICAGYDLEKVVVNGTTAIPELMVMALVRSESPVTKQICAVALMNVLIPETINKLIDYGIVWAMSSLSHQSQTYVQQQAQGQQRQAQLKDEESNKEITPSPRKKNGQVEPGKASLKAVQATAKFLQPKIQHSLVTACATAFLNLSCTEPGRVRILADSGALRAVFHFLLGGSGGAAEANEDGGTGEYVNHCQKLSWGIVWNLLQDPANHETLVLNDFLRTVETLAVTARSDVEAFHVGDGVHGGTHHKGDLDMDDHILREIFNLIDTDGSNTLDKYELLDAVTNNQQVLELVHSAPILAPLLQPDAFENALMDLDTAHSGIVTFSEFKAFLITQTRKISRANNEADVAKKQKQRQKEKRKSLKTLDEDDEDYDDDDGFEEDEDYEEDGGFEDDEDDDMSPSVASMMAVMNEQRRHMDAAGSEAATKHTALTLRNVAIAMRLLSCNDTICQSIIERSGISIIVAACRSTELETKEMCARVLCTLARHEETRQTIVAEGAMAALELISSSEEPVVQTLVATTLRLLSWHAPNAVIMTQQGLLNVSRKICTLAKERQSDRSMRSAIYDIAATLETVSWQPTASEVMAHSGGTKIIRMLLDYDIHHLCRPCIIAMCNMASCQGVHEPMFDDGAVQIFVDICTHTLYDNERVSTDFGEQVMADMRHRATLMAAYMASGLTSRRARSAMVEAGVVPPVLRLATMHSTSLVTKEVCASVICALSHAPSTRKQMIQDGALPVVTELAECGSQGARMNCTTAMGKLSASVIKLEQGTVASLISLCMAPPAHPESPKGSPRQRSSSLSSLKGGDSGNGNNVNQSSGGDNGKAQNNNNGNDASNKLGMSQDAIPVDPTILPAPPLATHHDDAAAERSKEMDEPKDVGPGEKLPEIFPVKWKKQQIHVDGVAPDAPVSGAATGTGSLENEALAIEANLVLNEIEDAETDDGEYFIL